MYLMCDFDHILRTYDVSKQVIEISHHIQNALNCEGILHNYLFRE